ncbi:DUF2637 domain-containing protein [Streptomyces sp. DT171]|uniref:DUF2637 domain-containing protein n=1 Tax=Streptomyces sp. DT171 TaxID=3416524 RepID=UPI003CFA7F9E
MAAMQLTRTHRVLIGVVVAGAVVIAAIGFAGSYAAVRELAEEKGFGNFSVVFPIGIDAGICVLLALDLLLTWFRIPFPLLRQTAWLLTAATIAFNGAAAWPDPLGTGMHAVIPVLFVVSVEAARHAVGRIADITADKHMEGVRITRWLLSPVPTFRLWRRMKLWELRSYEQVIKLEQDRLVYQARLQARFGRSWRRKAPIESLMPLRLAKYGVPLSETAPTGLAAAGIEPVLLPPVQPQPLSPAVESAAGSATAQPELTYASQRPAQQQAQQQVHQRAQERGRYAEDQYPEDRYPEGPYPEDRHADERYGPQQHPHHPAGAIPEEEWWPQEGPGSHESPWFAAQRIPDDAYEGAYDPAYEPVNEPAYPADAEHPENAARAGHPEPDAPVPAPDQPTEQRQPQPQPQPPQQQQQQQQQPSRQRRPETVPDLEYGPDPVPASTPDSDSDNDEFTAPGLPEGISREDAYFAAFRKYTQERGDYPNARQFALYLLDLYGVTGRTGGPLSENSLRGYLRDFRHRHQASMDAEPIA